VQGYVVRLNHLMPQERKVRLRPVRSKQKQNAAKRLGPVDAISTTLAFLASPLSDYANGANLRSDGGDVATVN